MSCFKEEPNLAWKPAVSRDSQLLGGPWPVRWPSVPLFYLLLWGRAVWEVKFKSKRIQILRKQDVLYVCGFLNLFLYITAAVMFCSWPKPFILKMTKTNAEGRNSWKCVCTFPLKMKTYIDFSETLVWKQTEKHCDRFEPFKFLKAHLFCCFALTFCFRSF